MGFVGGVTIASVVVLVIDGVVAALSESAVISYVIVALPLAVMLAVLVGVAAVAVRQSLPPMFVAPTVVLASPVAMSGARGRLTQVPGVTMPRPSVRAATVGVPGLAPGGRAPRARAVQNSWWTRNVWSGGWMGARSPSGGSPSGLSSPQQASRAHPEARTSRSVRRPTAPDQRPPLPPAISPAESPVIPPPVSLSQLAESSSILLELFSQGSHDNDEVSDEHHALLANATASFQTIHARIRQRARLREIVVPEPDCIICYAERADTVFMPCKHLVVCGVCISSD